MLSLSQKDNENIVHKIPFEDLYYSVYTGNRGTSQKLRDAAFDGDMTEVKRLLLTGFDLESPDASGTTVLSEAAVGGKVEIVKLLLKRVILNSIKEYKTNSSKQLMILDQSINPLYNQLTFFSLYS